MPEIDGVNVVPVDPRDEELASLKRERDGLRQHNNSMNRKLGRVRALVKELDDGGNPTAVLVKGALER